MAHRIKLQHLFALVLLTIVCTLYPEAHAETAAALADRMYNNFDIDEVMFPLSQALKEHPNDPQLHYLMGTMYMTRNGSKLRGQRELEICLKLDPNFPEAPHCEQLLDEWKKEQQEKGQKYSWSNLDYWFDDYYRTHEYHSTDPNPAPDWTKKHDNDREWKVDVHFIGGNFTLPFAGTAASYRAEWTRDFMTTFHNTWEKRVREAQIEGCADVYCTIDNDGIMHTTIARVTVPNVVAEVSPEETKIDHAKPPINSASTVTLVKMGRAASTGKGEVRADAAPPITPLAKLSVQARREAFKKLLLDTINSLNGSESFMKASRERPVFKARIAARHALVNSGTWYAFGSEGTLSGPVRVSLKAIVDTNKSGNAVSGAMLSSAPVPPLADTPPVAGSLQKKSNRDDRVQSLRAAKSAIDSLNFEKAYELLWPAVEDDDADACLLMAKALSSADNAHPQPRVAELFLDKAFKLGDKDSIAQLFDAIEFGNSGGRMSMEDAVDMLKKGADGGSSVCQFDMGRLFEFGDYVASDKKLAEHYYKLAAAAGNLDAVAGLERLRIPNGSGNQER